MEWIAILVFVLIIATSLIVMHVIEKDKPNKAKDLKSEILEQQSKLNKLILESNELSMKNRDYSTKIANLQIEGAHLQAQKNEIAESIKTLQDVETQQKELSDKRHKERLKELDSNYYEILESNKVELAKALQEAESANKTRMDELDNAFAILKSAVNRINELNAENSETGILAISKSSAFELSELMDVFAKLKLSNPTPFYKVVYDVYWKNLVANLVAQTQVRGVCGIYKIQNRINGKIYIGQSVDIGERWKQHIKRGCGAEIGTLAGGSLYEAMMEEGIGNFQFFLLEECDRANLTVREKFWINFYDSRTFGYNIK